MIFTLIAFYFNTPLITYQSLIVCIKILNLKRSREMSKFSEKLAQATNEDKQVNPIYVNEIAKTLPRIGGGQG